MESSDSIHCTKHSQITGAAQVLYSQVMVISRDGDSSSIFGLCFMALQFYGGEKKNANKLSLVYYKKYLQLVQVAFCPVAVPLWAVPLWAVISHWYAQIGIRSLFTVSFSGWEAAAPSSSPCVCPVLQFLIILVALLDLLWIHSCLSCAGEPWTRHSTQEVASQVIEKQAGTLLLTQTRMQLTFIHQKDFFWCVTFTCWIGCAKRCS